ncbi:hypothetical protein K435DRAFT_798179 [Dendrothele bispora CBS 962.96]|uniref:Uncharacterized protein n=1 Tax=Dendrothele bispora (strain CBS 962.96) TaxID=1314807 RepID=A0A4S8M044_DENBC|nr:hypothetical protein K435DRAFT_798179 [Dendrothele bispora CBS 962.96]
MDLQGTESPTPVFPFRAVSSSEAASLHGQKAKTPIIAGSICGGVMGLAWIIGFVIYFRKRIRRKRRDRALLAAGKLPTEKNKDPEEKIVIPPDPAVLMGHPPGKLPEDESRTSNVSPIPAEHSSPHTSNSLVAPTRELT